MDTIFVVLLKVNVVNLVCMSTRRKSMMQCLRFTSIPIKACTCWFLRYGDIVHTSFCLEYVNPVEIGWTNSPNYRMVAKRSLVCCIQKWLWLLIPCIPLCQQCFPSGSSQNQVHHMSLVGEHQWERTISL